MSEVSTRQHWGSIVVRNNLWLVIVLGAVVTWGVLHYAPGLPSRLPWKSREALALAHAVATLQKYTVPAYLVIVAIVLVSNVVVWSCSTLQVAGGNVSWRVGIVSETRIPLGAIQDLQISRSFGGLLFGYGTLTIRSGLAMERLPFVPNVAAIANVIQRGAW